MARCRQIVLVGFMGAGKSTVGPILAARLGWHWCDLDDALASEAGTSIAGIFEQHGEAHFRALESKEFARQLSAGRSELVLAVGGGLVEDDANRELLKSAPEVRTFYLEAPLNVLVARCVEQASLPGHATRPLLGQAGERFQHRAGLYAEVGTPVSTTGFSPEGVAAHIVGLLQMDNQLPVAQ